MLEKISDIRTDFEIFITDYGLRIGHLYDADSNFIKTEFIFAGGSSVDGDLKGISHFLEHLISPTQKLSNKVADYGLTNLNAYTIYRYNYYPYWQLLDLDLIKKIFSFYFQHFFSLGKSFLTKEAFLKEKARIKAEIFKNWPKKEYQQEMALLDYCATTVNPVNALGRPEELERIKLADIIDHHHKHYIAENFSLLVVGGLPKDDLLKILELVKAKDYLQKYKGKANKIISYPNVDFIQPVYKEFFVSKDQSNWEIHRSYFLPYEVDQDNVDLNVLEKVLYKILFQRLSCELGKIYDLQVKHYKSYLVNQHWEFDIVIIVNDWASVKIVQKEINHLCANFYKQGKKYFEASRKDLRNQIFFKLPVPFQRDILEFFRNSLYENFLSFKTNAELVSNYEHMVWKDLQKFSKYFQDDKGFCIIIGAEV